MVPHLQGESSNFYSNLSVRFHGSPPPGNSKFQNQKRDFQKPLHNRAPVNWNQELNQGVQRAPVFVAAPVNYRGRDKTPLDIRLIRTSPKIDLRNEVMLTKENTNLSLDRPAPMARTVTTPIPSSPSLHQLAGRERAHQQVAPAFSALRRPAMPSFCHSPQLRCLRPPPTHGFDRMGRKQHCKIDPDGAFSNAKT